MGLDVRRASKKCEKCRFQGLRLREYAKKGAKKAGFTSFGLGRKSKRCENCRFLGFVLRVVLQKRRFFFLGGGLCGG